MGLAYIVRQLVQQLRKLREFWRTWHVLLICYFLGDILEYCGEMEVPALPVSSFYTNDLAEALGTVAQGACFGFHNGGQAILAWMCSGVYI